MAGERILVVDGDAEAREALRTLILEPEDYEVLMASDGAEGLRLAQEERPDLIILGEETPGMSGVDVLKGLREREFSIPVLFATLRGSEDLVVKAFRLGVRDWVVKPFEPEETQRTIKDVLKEAQLRRERDNLLTQLQEANEHLKQQVEELHSIGHSVISLLDTEDVLTRVVEAAVSVTKAEEGLLLLVEDDDLVLRAAKNLDEKVARGLRVQVDDNLASEVIQTGRSVLIGGERAKIATGHHVNALVYMPLKTAGRGIIGVLGVANRHSDYPFAEHEVQMLSTLADYAGVAVENARLYDQAETEGQQLKAVLQETEEAVIVLDTEQRIVLCNPTAYGALDLPADAVGQLARTVISHPSLREILEAVPKAGRTLRAEVAVDDGRAFNAQVSPVEGVGYVLMMQDITHLKELDRVKSEFVFTVSHDLRTPLTTIQGYVSLLERVGPLNEQQRQFVERIHTGITDITNLVSEVLDLGRIEAGYDLEMQPLHLERIIDAVVDQFRPAARMKAQELRWERRPLPVVRGSAQRLRQVVENLLSNAVNYTLEGGWISIEATEGEEHVAVRVADNGVGIPLADQPYIFERFYRVESRETQDVKGTGLGLTIVRSVVEKHGGRVWVESRPGVGSVFTFVLPTME
ncbi:MAG: ATP-binding protein [Anaerolineae bacterium]